jgi:hypothetical protein
MCALPLRSQQLIQRLLHLLDGHHFNSQGFLQSFHRQLRNNRMFEAWLYRFGETLVNLRYGDNGSDRNHQFFNP